MTFYRRFIPILAISPQNRSISVGKNAESIYNDLSEYVGCSKAPQSSKPKADVEQIAEQSRIAVPEIVFIIALRLGWSE
ncbi:hypothetical protein BD311DRAFT_753370 [Dichomitus squalens]|uniref:Uncharacterized protein n=1 Tax=Dichomitus squalens TaxID=114155 RepID=A0A4Q9MUW4_9APHY|nr:hypothetical protein BD311DRAFT_753370 [Dichomitus squalens]